MAKRGGTDLWCLERDGEFLGMAATVNGDGMILLDYLAVERKNRGQGIGTAALGALLEVYRDKGVFVEIESTRRGGAEQEKRKRFYLAAGLEELGTSALVFGVEMDLLGICCQLDFDGYKAFYRDHYSPWAAEHLQPIE